MNRERGCTIIGLLQQKEERERGNGSLSSTSKASAVCVSLARLPSQSRVYPPGRKPLTFCRPQSFLHFPTRFSFFFLSIAIAISKRSDLSSFWKNKTRFESGPTIIDFAYVIECRLRQLYDDDDDDGGEKGCRTHTHKKPHANNRIINEKDQTLSCFFSKRPLRSSTKEVIVGKLMSLPPINPTQIR